MVTGAPIAQCEASDVEVGVGLRKPRQKAEAGKCRAKDICWESGKKGREGGEEGVRNRARLQVNERITCCYKATQLLTSRTEVLHLDNNKATKKLCTFKQEDMKALDWEKNIQMRNYFLLFILKEENLEKEVNHNTEGAAISYLYKILLTKSFYL